MYYTAADAAKLLGTKMKRFIEFDVLRGILLLMMSVDHSPSSLRRFTDQPLGFFSTAECFVFVSAFLAGMIFRKRAEKLGFAAAGSSSIHRAGRLYRAHLVTLSFAFVLGSFFLSDLPGIRNLLDRYLIDPGAAIAGSLALLFRPPLMDILPMYVLFSFLTPAAFGAARRWGWKTVLFASFSVWVTAQTCQGDFGQCIQRASVRPTRSVRSSRMAVSLGRRAVHRSAFSGKRGPAEEASFATTDLIALGDRFSFLALDSYHQRPRSNY
jgi:hypothetical protein